jgi:hypothetical protein
MKTTFGRELIDSAGEALAIARGQVGPARAFVGEDVDVAAIRAVCICRRRDSPNGSAWRRPPSAIGNRAAASPTGSPARF